MTVAVRCDGKRVRCNWEDPFRRFLVDTPGKVDLDLRVDLASSLPTGDGQLLFDSDSVWRMFRTADGYRLECRSEAFGDTPYKVALIDDDFTQGTILLREDHADLHPLDYPLDEVLIAHLLGRGRGVELHSCGVIDRQGRGHLFVGVSGAGKSTTARLWGDAAAGIVSDDRVIVCEQDGAMWMYGTPWHGEAELAMASGVPLHGVYLLVQSEQNALLPLSHAHAVARLFGCTFPLFYDAAAVDFTVSFLARLAASVRVRELFFRRDPSVVDLVLAGAA
ncbi:MAG TPA: hypothetical protein VEK57_24190 [Thermoanaerobaculia bacterium]|nr:hypothetical protein [Thermoanaerobaculia bacterium]